MSRIEELPDDFDTSIDLNKPPADVSLEDLYRDKFENAANADQPRLEDGRSTEEIMQEFSKTPLFMNSLDDAGDADGENIALDAIRALQYEGTKAEIAQGFKERGNEMVKDKMWKDAKEFYTKGIAVLTDEQGGDKWEQGEDPVIEAKKEKELEEQCYVNRALCQLELKNYRSTTLDCAAAIRLNPSNIKAHYRSAAALLALEKTVEATDACSRGLKLEPRNAALQKLQIQIQARVKIQEAKSQKLLAEQFQRRKEKMTLAAAVQARQIRLRGSDKPPDLEDASIHLSPDPLSPTSTLVFPVVLLYPMHAQSDFIKAFAEKDAITDHLSYIFPLPWDGQAEYRVGSVDCYMDTITGGLIKVGKKLSLLQALTSGKTEIVDGLVRIHVVPTALAGKWIEDMKKRKGR